MVRDRWKEKATHGKFPNYLDKDHVDVELSFEWMKHTRLKGETEGLSQQHMIGHWTPDTTANTSSNKEPLTDAECAISSQKLWNTSYQGVKHYTADQYLKRHNHIAAQLHLDICRHYGIKVKAECWYQHKPEGVMENEKATILWDSPIITDKTCLPCNKPDIVIQEKKSDRCQIIDVAIPSDYNIQKKATEKMSKYVDLQIECQRMWNKKVEVIPVIIGATGIVDKNIKKYVGRIPGHHNIYSLHRSAILGNEHILRKVLSIKPY